MLKPPERAMCGPCADCITGFGRIPSSEVETVDEEAVQPPQQPVQYRARMTVNVCG